MSGRKRPRVGELLFLLISLQEAETLVSEEEVRRFVQEFKIQKLGLRFSGNKKGTGRSTARSPRAKT